MRAPETVYVAECWTFNEHDGSSTELLGIFWAFESAEGACKAHHARQWASGKPWTPLTPRKPYFRVPEEPTSWSNQTDQGVMEEGGYGWSEGYSVEKTTVS